MNKLEKKVLDVAFTTVFLLDIIWLGLYKNTKLTIILLGTLMILVPFIWLIYRLVSGD